MSKILKNKTLVVVIFELLVIILSIIGITFATSKLLNDRANTLVTTGDYNLDYVGNSDVKMENIEPISDQLINYNTTDGVVRIEFSLRGVRSNKNDKLIYDVMLKDMDIDCSLLNKYTKWNLYKNGNLLSTGSLDPLFDGDVLDNNMRLTTIQEDLPEYNQDYDKYVLLFWISEACDDLEKCTLIDQSNVIDSKMKMKVFIALYKGEKKEYTRVPNYDGTCANEPMLEEGMIPIAYKDGKWVVSDKNNNDKDNLWYSYSASKWANSVVVNDNNKYKNVGTVIDNNDVLGYFVWIPRFRYKLWNVENEIRDSYQAYDNGIDVIFENGINKTDNQLENNQYLTHPVFGDNLRGIWVSKYEISKDNDIYKFIPNVDSYRNDTLDNYKSIGNNIANQYKIDEKIESHMINNLEWGATLYLSHSKYGVCSGDGCDKIAVNDSYIAGQNKQDTTTRNVYGVYDVAGGSGEYVLGKSEIGTATGEVMTTTGTWYNGNGLLSSRDYIIRGGLDKELFYFGDIAMDMTQNSTRVVLTNKMN